MPEPVAPKEWEEDVKNTALCDFDNADAESFDSEDALVNEWGEEDEAGFATQFVKGDE